MFIKQNHVKSYSHNNMFISLKKPWYYVELLNKLVVMDSIDKQVFKAWNNFQN